MKIAFFTHCLPSRDSHGAAETCYSIIKFLKSQNHEIILNIIADDNEYNLSHNNSSLVRSTSSILVFWMIDMMFVMTNEEEETAFVRL